jgi:hypothetical protein
LGGRERHRASKEALCGQGEDFSFFNRLSEKAAPRAAFCCARRTYLQVEGKYLAGTVLFSLQEYTKL